MTEQNSGKLKYAGLGTVIGAVIVVVLGFTWGGWVTANTSQEQSDAAVLASRAAICVAQFTMSPDNKALLKTFQETESWKRSEFVNKGGWDKMPGEETARGFVSRACADGIEVLLEK